MGPFWLFVLAGHESSRLSFTAVALTLILASRIASSVPLSVLSGESINSIPTAEVCRLICVIYAAKDEALLSACSREHSRANSGCLDTRTRAKSFLRFDLPG